MFEMILTTFHFGYRISTKYINAKQLQMEQDQCEGRESVKTLLQVYLSSKELDSKDVLTMISDMLLAGVDTVYIFY